MYSPICPSWKRGVAVFATERSSPTVGTVEPSAVRPNCLKRDRTCG